MTGRPFRVIDTGLRDARANVAFSQALIDARKQGAVPDTIRFQRFQPSVLIGRHQVLASEVRVDRCRKMGLAIARRTTGGGVVFMTPGMLGWELVCHRDTLETDDLGDLARLICEAAVDGISRLGLPATYRPRNDIEVDGSKISGTGGYFDGDTLCYQGTLLIDFDPQALIEALNVPNAKEARKALESAAQRVVTVRELLGERVPELPTIQKMLLNGFSARLDISGEPGAITEQEESLAQKLLQERYDDESFVDGVREPSPTPDLAAATHSAAGGTLRAHVWLEPPAHRQIRDVQLSGDFFVTPPELVGRLQASLRGVAADQAPAAIDRFFAQAKVGLTTISPDDVKAVIDTAVKQRAA